jgi:hypothetical protein
MLCFLAGCANKVAPTGGPKDIVPPKVIGTNPDLGATSVSSNKITISFDEFVQLKDASKQVLISPPSTIKPVITASGKTVKVDFEKLADTTTYVIDFGNAIVDLNESNPLTGYRFVFSTGAELDTLSVGGRAFDMTTGKPLKGAMAMLFDAQIPDSVMVMRMPDHFARCDENGRFRIDNAASGTYRLVVLMEKTENYLLDEPGELAGFTNDVIKLPVSGEEEVWATPQPPAAVRLLSTSLIPPATLLSAFNTDARSIVFEGLNVSLKDAIIRFNQTYDTVSVFLDRIPDTLPVSLILKKDGVLFDTVSYNTRSSSKIEGKGAGLKWSLDLDLFGDADTTLNFKISTPIRSASLNKFHLTMDSVEQPITNLSVSNDSMSVAIVKPKKPGKYIVSIEAGAVTDIYGRQSDSAAMEFEIPSEKNRGAIGCKFTNPPASNDIIQLLDDQSRVVRKMKASEGMVFQSLPPGKYRIRLLKDANGNHQWDYGNIRKSVMPETLVYHPGEITVRGNWDIDVVLTF